MFLQKLGNIDGVILRFCNVVWHIGIAAGRLEGHLRGYECVFTNAVNTRLSPLNLSQLLREILSTCSGVSGLGIAVLELSLMITDEVTD